MHDEPRRKTEERWGWGTHTEDEGERPGTVAHENADDGLFTERARDALVELDEGEDEHQSLERERGGSESDFREHTLRHREDSALGSDERFERVYVPVRDEEAGGVRNEACWEECQAREDEAETDDHHDDLRGERGEEYEEHDFVFVIEDID